LPERRDLGLSGGDDDGSFVENPIKRYTFGDRTPGIVTNGDGSLDVYIQHRAPSDAKKQATCLPSAGWWLLPKPPIVFAGQ